MPTIFSMRAFLTTSLGVACTAALALPLALPAGAADTVPAAAAPLPAPLAELPGSTQSLPLAPLRSSDRAMGAAGPAAQGLPAQDVKPFSLLGVVWDDAGAALHGRVQARTRATGTTTWSAWQDLDAHSDDAPDPGTAERAGRPVRGGTAPLWVGDSDGVQLRITPESGRRAATALPGGLRLELVDPGEQPAEPDPGSPRRARPVPSGVPLSLTTPGSAASSAVNAQLAPLGATEIPALDKAASEADAMAAYDGSRGTTARPFVGPRPRIVTRAGWGADEKLREKDFAYTQTVQAAFVHHTDSGNNYSCRQAPSVIRSIYRYHVKSWGWRDVGYNFLVDKCGTVYEGRAGGVAKPVMGAHTLGFNSNSMGIAVLGTFVNANPPRPAVDAVARLAAWKLGLYGADPRGTTHLVSAGGNRFEKGAKVRMNVISGHRDGFNTECPGGRLYRKLDAARSTSAHLQGR